MEAKEHDLPAPQKKVNNGALLGGVVSEASVGSGVALVGGAMVT